MQDRCFLLLLRVRASDRVLNYFASVVPELISVHHWAQNWFCEDRCFTLRVMFDYRCYCIRDCYYLKYSLRVMVIYSRIFGEFLFCFFVLCTYGQMEVQGVAFYSLDEDWRDGGALGVPYPETTELFSWCNCRALVLKVMSIEGRCIQAFGRNIYSFREAWYSCEHSNFLVSPEDLSPNLFEQVALVVWCYCYY